jgi:hypothetical protein
MSEATCGTTPISLRSPGPRFLIRADTGANLGLIKRDDIDDGVQCRKTEVLQLRYILNVSTLFAEPLKEL